MNLDPKTISNLIMGGAAWGAAFLVALWVSLIIWTYRDMRSRARDPLLRILAVIIVALLFLPGIVIYLSYALRTLWKKNTSTHWKIYTGMIRGREIKFSSQPQFYWHSPTLFIGR